MARDSGNTLQSARSLNLATGAKTRRETIGGSDTRDFFKVDLTSRSSFDLSLRKLRSNVDVALLNSARRVINFSRQPGRRAESIKTNLDAGTYYIRLSNRKASTGYELKVAATVLSGGGTGGGGTGGSGTGGGGTPANTAPTIATNTALTVSRNGMGTIGRTNLLSIDTQQTGDQLLYRVTTLPTAGSLFLNGTLLGVGSAFTQTDLDNNRLTYKQNSVKPIPNTGQVSSSGAPKISGSNVVWAAEDAAGDTEIFFYRGSTGTVTQLSDNAVNDRNPEIFGSNVVWQSGEGDAAEIYLYSDAAGAPAIRLTNNSSADSKPKISDSYVVWQQKHSSGAIEEHDIRYYRLGDPATTIATVNGSTTFDDINPVISGSKIAFLRDDKTSGSTTPDGIYFRDLAVASSETQVTTGSAGYTDLNLRISGSTVVWEREYTGGDRDIKYDTDPLTAGFQSVDTTSLIDELPLLSGSNIVFRRSGTSGGTMDGGYVFKIGGAGTATRFAIGSSYQISSLDGDRVGWTTLTGANVTANLYNIATGTNLTLDGGAPVQGAVALSGENAVWVGGTGLTAIDRLFFLDSSIAADSFGFSVSDGSLTTNGTFNLTVS